MGDVEVTEIPVDEEKIRELISGLCGLSEKILGVLDKNRQSMLNVAVALGSWSVMLAELALTTQELDQDSAENFAEVFVMVDDEAVRTYRRLAALEDSPANRYRALAGVDIDTNYAFAHYELGRVALREYDRRRSPESLQAALSELNAALRIVGQYFSVAEATDKMFLMLRRPREYRAENMRKLEAKSRWRLAQVHESLGEEVRALEERSAAQVMWPQVAEVAEAEDAEGDVR